MDINFFKMTAFDKSFFSNTCNTTTNSQISKVKAVAESLNSNASYAIGDGNGGEIDTTPKCMISNTRDAIRDCDGGKRIAKRE